MSSGSPGFPHKAIGSLAKKPSDVTHQGTQKLKFVPTLPARRKKDEATHEDFGQRSSFLANEKGIRIRRDGGRGDGKGVGQGRVQQIEMTASGPFAMGPSVAGNCSRRSISRSNIALGPVSVANHTLMPISGSSSYPTIKSDPEVRVKLIKSAADEGVYSEPDEGVEIIDIEYVSHMDRMAPESLYTATKKLKEPVDGRVSDTYFFERKANAKEELDGFVDNFRDRGDAEQKAALQGLYFFQFPAPFAPFMLNNGNFTMRDSPLQTRLRDTAASPCIKNDPETLSSPDFKPSQDPVVDGIIGELFVYHSGAVKMKLSNDILLDVNAATQPSFLQHAVFIDAPEKRSVVLGEVNRRFSASPDIDALLTSLELAE